MPSRTADIKHQGLLPNIDRPDTFPRNVFLNGTEERQKEALRNDVDLGSIVELTLELMMKFMIPKSGVDVQQTMKHLVDTRIWSETEGWRTFDALRLKKAIKKRDMFFNMRKIHDHIVLSTRFSEKEKPNQTLNFDRPSNVMTVFDTAARVRPDLCGFLTNDHAIHSGKQFQSTFQPGDNTYQYKPANCGNQTWFDIAYVEEHQLGNEFDDVNDNIWKMLWSLHHAMQIDHRRRFMYGLTIEKNTARIWLCCRQTIVVSQSFDFNKEPLYLVHFIASLAYASPTQLGYDPNVILRRRNEGWHYDIKLTTELADGTKLDKVYRTCRVISNSSGSIRSRATRIYEAETDNTDDSSTIRRVVLKDSWIDASRPTEGNTLNDLLKEASEDEKRMFLTVVQHGVVQIDGQEDTTGHLILKGQTVDIVDKMAKRLPPLGMLGPIPDPLVYTPEESATFILTRRAVFPLYHSSRPRRRDLYMDFGPPMPVVHPPKHHYRIVFKEIGESLMSLANCGMMRAPLVNQMLSDITSALQFMAKKGYVHRDISPGNILICDGKHAKLADLEYAKRYDNNDDVPTRRSRNVDRVGTYHFLASEVAAGQYSINRLLRPFTYNPVHDLESLWWVGVWCMILHYPVPDNKEIDSSLHSHINAMWRHNLELFPSADKDWQYTMKIHEILSETTFAMRGFNGYPTGIMAILSRLNHFRQCIASSYKKIEKTLPRHDTAYFAEVLQIPDPQNVCADDELDKPSTEADDRVPQRPVHDMIIAKLNAAKDKFPIPDTLLWPLNSISLHSKWIRSKSNPH